MEKERLERADMGWIDTYQDERYVMDDYGFLSWIPFSAPIWEIQGFDPI